MRTILSILLITIAFAASAGPKSKSIKGTILGTQNDGLAGAKIEVKGTDIVVYSDFDGNFSIDRLKSGTYELSITMISYQELEIQMDAEELDQSRFRLQSR